MKYALTFLFIVSGLQRSFSQGGSEELLGLPRDKIEELKSKPDLKQVLTGDYYSLAFTFVDKTTPLIGIRFDFDRATPSNNTLCQIITVLCKMNELEFIRKKLAGDFPFYDDEDKIYHNNKTGAIIKTDDPKKLIARVLYFNYDSTHHQK